MDTSNDPRHLPDPWEYPSKMPIDDDECINQKACEVKQDLNALIDCISDCPDQLVTLFQCLIRLSQSKYKSDEMNEAIIDVDEAFSDYAAAVAESILMARSKHNED